VRVILDSRSSQLENSLSETAAGTGGTKILHAPAEDDNLLMAAPIEEVAKAPMTLSAEAGPDTKQEVAPAILQSHVDEFPSRIVNDAHTTSDEEAGAAQQGTNAASLDLLEKT